MHKRLNAVCQNLKTSYEILLIDDGSPDKTWDSIVRIAKKDPNTQGIKLSKNHGHQLAVTAGLKHAKGARVLIIDSDLQDPPELLPQMMEMMDKGADNVYGQRLSRKGVPFWKESLYKMFYKILNILSGCYIPPNTGDFRLINRRIVDIVNTMPEYPKFLRGMISWLGFNQVPLFYHRNERFAGESGYTLSKLFSLAIDGITSFSIKPLRFASIVGALFALLSLGFILVTIINYYQGQIAVAGWTSLAVLVLLTSSVHLLLLGLIGEYIGRLFLQSKKRPAYLIMETTPRNHE
jgi:polyisoprenyl-phosphate glycosyltransferase